MPMTASPAMREMPLTPLVLRPMARASLVGEADGHALPGAQNNFVALLDVGDVDERVAFFEIDADDTARLGSAVLLKGGFLDKAGPRGHEKITGGVKPSHRNDARDFFFFFERQHIGDGPARTRAAHLRDFVNLQPIHLPVIGEAEQIGVRRGTEKMIDPIVLARCPAGNALAAAVLRAIGIERQPLDIAVVADRDGVNFLDDQFLHGCPVQFTFDNLRCAAPRHTCRAVPPCRPG